MCTMVTPLTPPPTFSSSTFKNLAHTCDNDKINTQIKPTSNFNQGRQDLKMG